jgi:hypothetical protein
MHIMSATWATIMDKDAEDFDYIMMIVSRVPHDVFKCMYAADPYVEALRTKLLKRLGEAVGYLPPAR